MTRTLLIYGDSNTHGTLPLTELGEIGRHPPGRRWTDILAARLAPGWTVIAEGHPGRTTVHDDPIEGEHRNGARILPALLESHRPIDLLAIHLGTNDLKPRFSAGPADIAAGLERLVRMARASAAGPGGGAPAILLLCPPPIREAGCLAETFAGGAAKSRGLATAVARMAGRQGAAFLDLGGVVTVSPTDGIHYEADQQAPLAQAVAAAVADV
ncbi:MAG: GDSL-type esterase/lipase family protein [Rhodobacteraceae bacterium]|nr:GDSL-type esterase/lipase family protein [Paracoccaceae bacterium]